MAEVERDRQAEKALEAEPVPMTAAQVIAQFEAEGRPVRIIPRKEG